MNRLVLIYLAELTAYYSSVDVTTLPRYGAHGAGIPAERVLA